MRENCMSGLMRGSDGIGNSPSLGCKHDTESFLCGGRHDGACLLLWPRRTKVFSFSR